MKDTVIVGNGIGAQVLYHYLVQDHRYRVVAFSVDSAYISGDRLEGLPVVALEDLAAQHDPERCSVLLGIGYSQLNMVRKGLFSRVKSMGYAVETYVHPSAIALHGSAIGEGCVILAGTVVEPYAKVGANSFVWCNCVIAHHSVVGDDVWIASNSVLSGEAQVRDRCFLGVCATVANRVVVAEDNIIGANAFVSRNTSPNEVWLARSAEKHRFDAQNYARYFLK